jgi:hypothetical protein
MKLRTRLDAQAIRHHLRYYIWYYLLILVLSFAAWSLIYTQTAYRVPQEKRIDLYIQATGADPDVVNAFLKPIWEKAVPLQESVKAVMLLSPGGANDYYSNMQLITYITAAEGDIYMLSSDDFRRLAGQGIFLDLGEAVASGRINAGSLDLSPGRVSLTMEDEAGNLLPSSEPRLFGIPAAGLNRFMSDMMIDNRGLVLSISMNSGNKEAALSFLDALIQATRSPEPHPP